MSTELGKSAGPHGGQGREEAPKRVDLKEIVTKCVDIYIGLGFHRVVYFDLSEEEAIEKYRKDFTVPRDARQPAEYQGCFDVVIVHEPRVTVTEKSSRARIHAWIHPGDITNLPEIPDKPYIAFTHDGTRYLEFSTVNQAMERFSDDEVGEPLTETIGVYSIYSEFFENGGRIAAGSSTKNDSVVPYLNPFDENGEPEINVEPPDYPSRGNRVGSRGKEIIKLGL